MKTKKHTIVLAKAEENREVDGRTWLGAERLKWKDVDAAKALMWRNKGTEEDIETAHRFADAEGYTVFVYPTTERDPLGRAKKEILTGRPKRS